MKRYDNHGPWMDYIFSKGLKMKKFISQTIEYH